MRPSKRRKLNRRWQHLPRLGAVCVGFIVGLGGAPETAMGGEWTSNFSTLTSATYNDNPSLATENAKGRTDFTVNRALDGEYSKDRYRIGIVGQANLVASKEEIANSIFAADQIRYNLNVNGEYDYDTSVIAAAFGLGFDTVQNTEFADSGNLTSDVTRTNANLGMQYNRELTDRWSMNLSDDYSVASYSGGNFTAYSNNSILAGFSNTLTERLTLSPGIGFSRYKPDSNILKPSNTIRLQVSGQYELSETDSMGITIGLLQTDGDLGWSALVDYTQELLDGLVAVANINRDNVPSSTGNVRQSTGLSGGLRYQLTENMQVGLNGSWRTSSQVGATGSAVTTQLSLDPSVNWTLSERWRAGLNMQSRQQKQPLGETASSRSVIFALNYNLPLE